MAMLTVPVTLPVSKVISTMTTLIGEVRFKETLQATEIVNDLVASCRIGNVDFGKGIVFNFKVAPQPTKDLSETSSAFNITKPNDVQEIITIDEYKFIPLSISRILTRDAVLDGTTLDTFFSFVMGLLDTTEQFNLFEVCNNMLQNWTPGQETQTISVDQIDTTGLSGAELNNALIWNSNEVAKAIRKTINNMKIPNTKYTDASKYTDQNDNEEKDVISAISGRDLTVTFNDTYYTDFLASSMASLYHAEKIGEMIPADNFVLLPEDAMSEYNKNTICWVYQKGKFALADFYKSTLSILDPSTLYENYFQHYAYGAGVFQHAVGVKFVANIIEQEP